jgi:hypothetical protein
MEVLAVLEEVLALDANHAGANHLYIHAVEASPFPEKGIPSADRLRTLVPGSGHLVHMPAHIDVQTGQWKKAATANERAIEVDRRYRKISPKQGFYRLYMLHNDHFLAFACMMQGRSKDALRAAHGMIESIPDEFVKESPAFVDPYMSIVIETLMRFGRWDELLAQPEPDASLPITVAKWTFARAVALGAKGEAAKARAEQAAFREACKRVPEDAMMALNKAHAVLAIADGMLEGELCYREGRIDESVAALRKAVALEDDLRYMEPPEWIQPVRHTLGAVLMSAERWAEAEAVYRKDLEVWPENGWSLFGLWKTLAKRGEADAAADAKRRFDAVWAGADVEICATCLCVEPAK